MADLSTEERCRIAVRFVEQAPPGEVNDVINDIRAIIADDDSLMPLILPSLRAYNLSQLTVVEHPAAEGVQAHTSLLSEAAILPGSETERYVDAVGQRSFAFDHATLAVSDYQPYELPEEEASFRAELAKSLAAYTANHFPSGHSGVSCSQYPLLPPAPPAAVAAQAHTVSAGRSTDADLPATEVVTDVVPEQVGAGEAEPAPTPAVGTVAVSEVAEPGGLEKLDEAVEAEKQAEEKEEVIGGAAEITNEDNTAAKQSSGPPVVEEESIPVPSEATASAATDTPTAEEEAEVAKTATTVEEVVAVSAVSHEALPASAPEKKQERLDNPTYTLEVVGNRYNPSNFWTGRWRTRWVVDQKAEEVQGSIVVDVHYYEQGNVQLATKHLVSFPYPSGANGAQSVPSQIVTTISKIEAAYQMELNDAYGDLGDRVFRSLRRALPVTRQKMDWDKVSGYSLGADLTKARG